MPTPSASSESAPAPAPAPKLKPKTALAVPAGLGALIGGGAAPKPADVELGTPVPATEADDDKSVAEGQGIKAGKGTEADVREGQHDGSKLVKVGRAKSSHSINALAGKLNLNAGLLGGGSPFGGGGSTREGAAEAVAASPHGLQVRCESPTPTHK